MFWPDMRSQSVDSALLRVVVQRNETFVVQGIEDALHVPAMCVAPAAAVVPEVVRLNAKLGQHEPLASAQPGVADLGFLAHRVGNITSQALRVTLWPTKTLQWLFPH